MVTSMPVDQRIAELDGKPFPSAEVTQCPYPAYRALQEQAPVYQLPSGEYVITRHADVNRLTRDTAALSSHHSVMDDGYMRAATLADHEDPDRVWSIVASDPPEHTLKRKIAFEMFKPGRLREREPMVRAFADELIDGFIDRGGCEFVSEFANLLPAKVILTLFGLPLDHLDRALAWGGYEGFGTRFASQAHQDAARTSILDLGGFLRGEILQRVDEPGDDDLSIQVHRHIEANGELKLPDLIAEVSNLFIGGIITTTHLISSMMMLFIEHPDQQAIAAAGGPALKRAVEETLRIESPVQLGPRLALKDLEVEDVTIPAGSILLMVWGAANRDESTFDNPEEFDVERQNVKNHVAFGNGPHFCMGAPLGRMEAVTAFEQIFARLANLRFAPGKNDFRNQEAVIFRGPGHLFIEFDRA
jgi:cytochrome P450